MPTNNDPSPENFDDSTLPPPKDLPSSHQPDEFATVIPVSGNDDATFVPAVDADVTCVPVRNLSSQVSAESRVRYFGDYELLSEIARGGMGVVYKARQVNLNRVVALKMILAGNLASDEDVQRFRTEAEAAANLDHPGIVPIYEIGQHEGQHFFSMGYVDGCSLADRVRNGPLPPKEAAELTKKIAEAIAFAHSRNVIHRDLKPANVLLDKNGEPKVTDFGLARKMGSDSGLTKTGDFLGTPSYMPPEQAAGKTSEVGPLSDVYSLGAMLYCLLTGRPPFQAANPFDTMMQVMENDPVPLRLLNSRVDRDIETICMKCLEKSSSRRYPSSLALASDLKRYIEGEPISAKSISVVDRMNRTLRRSQIDVDFEAWSLVLIWFAGIILATQMALFYVIRNRLPLSAVLGTQTAQFAFMAAVLWRYRSPRLMVHNTSQKLLYSIWIGFLIASGLTGFICLRMVEEETMYNFFCYPFWCILSGFAFFAMGHNYWGLFYAFAVVFFGAAMVLTFIPIASAPIFGALWATSLLIIGLRLRSSARSIAGTIQSIR